ncbi:MAG: family rane protein [Phenylobacterium sp.]|nr:family rane protein [Phenylobacterium sp.]
MRQPRRMKGAQIMFAAIAGVLLVLWLLGFLAFHVTSAVIHLLLLVAVVLIVLHFLRGRRTT